MHLLMLSCYSLFTVILIAETVVLKWEIAAVPPMLFGMAVCWTLYIIRSDFVTAQMLLCFALVMLEFFYFGIHQHSVFNLTAVMIFCIIICSVAMENNRLVSVCIVVYAFTAGYNLLFHARAGESPFFTRPIWIFQMLIHFAVVYISGKVMKIKNERQKRQRENTDRKILELVAVNRRMDDFLTNVSHELRTPVNVITGISTVMLENESTEKKRKDLFAVRMAGQRLFDRIEDILDYTEIDTGRIKVNNEDYMISSLVNDLIENERVVSQDSGLEIVFDIDPGLPFVISGDERKIRKVMHHLLSNAVKFTKEGGVYVRISFLPRDYGINLCITVCDTGPGLAEADAAKVYKRFYQTEQGQNRTAGGLGLGLFIVHGLVRAMEGFVRFSASPGEGTTVSVSIPQRVSDKVPLVSVMDKPSLVIAVFITMEGYLPAVKNFYNEMIFHMVQGLDIPIHRVFNQDELQRLLSMYHVTHLFTSDEEYAVYGEFFERIDPAVEVVVVAGSGFSLPPASRARIVRKPFGCLSIINILNSRTPDTQANPDKKRMVCPGVRVLVVDDEPMNLMVAEGIFNGYQMQVTLADSGAKALILCAKQDFDLVFLDYMMPDMDGAETLKRMRKIYSVSNRSPKIVAFTANAVSGAREMLLQKGFDEFVSKPVDVPVLERVLRRILPAAAVSFADEVPAVDGRVPVSAPPAALSVPLPEKTADAPPQTDGIMQRLEAGGIRTQTGMQFCRGDSSFYLELLAQFTGSAQERIRDLERFFGEEDWAQYCIRTHALKSAAKMIGADDLSETARRSEDAAKKTDEAAARANHPVLLEEFRRIVQCISEALCAENPAGGASGGTSAGTETLASGPAETEIPPAQILDALEKLQDSLHDFDAEAAGKQIAEMESWKAAFHGNPLSALLAGIKQDAEDFEFGPAGEKTAGLIGRIKKEITG